MILGWGKVGEGVESGNPQGDKLVCNWLMRIKLGYHWLRITHLPLIVDFRSFKLSGNKRSLRALIVPISDRG